MTGMPAGALAAPGEALVRVVHDLHGPLTVIRGLCATLSRDEAHPDRRRAIALIDAEALRLADGLRGLTRAADRDPRPVAAPVDLAALAASVAERFAAVAARRGASLSLRGAHRPVWVEGDAALLERAVENLLGNAVRHCAADGSVALALSARGGRAVVRVRDDGAGVAVADRERIFRPGERGGEPRGEGRGLGLAIARDIAEAHGGRLSLDPVGVGACFRLSVPLAPVFDRGPRAA